ncbi:MAG TPA: hypothetical protein VLK33_06775 [Terriglobales bacterium]|nr:hypothetical protein [Terriglobales bacterium]
MKCFLLTCAAFAFCVCTGVWQSRGQTPSNVSATVAFDNGETATVTDFSNQIGVQSGEFITITMQFPAGEAAGKPVVVNLPDGGSSSVAGNLPVANSDGSITFMFVATADPGANRVNVHIGSITVCLQLWVMDSRNPQNNPPNLAAVSHN